MVEQTTDPQETSAGRLDLSTRQVLLDPMNSIAGQLNHEISLCLRYHTVTFRGQRIGSALLSGVGAETSLLMDTFRRHLPCEVSVAQSFRGLKSLGGLGYIPRKFPTQLIAQEYSSALTALRLIRS